MRVVGLLVDGLADLASRLQNAGDLVVDQPVEDRERVYVHDPFGNRLERIERG